MGWFCSRAEVAETSVVSRNHWPGTQMFPVALRDLRWTISKFCSLHESIWILQFTSIIQLILHPFLTARSVSIRIPYRKRCINNLHDLLLEFSLFFFPLSCGKVLLFLSVSFFFIQKYKLIDRSLVPIVFVFKFHLFEIFSSYLAFKNNGNMTVSVQFYKHRAVPTSPY